MLLAPGVGAEATGPLKYRLADAGRHVEFRDVAPQPGAVLPDQVRAVVQQAHALLDGERQSVGVGVQERGELRRDRFPAEHRGHQLRGRRGVQGPWFHPDATGLCDQPPQQRPGPYLLGPVGQDESRGALPLGPQQQQEFHGRFVGPVRVLHHEQLDTEGVDEFDERAEQTAPGRRGVGQRVAGGGQLLGPLREDRPQHSRRRGERHVHETLGRLAHGVDDRRECVRLPQRRAHRDQRALASP
ncbi:hypothetical protein OG310_34645 [Streptomyces sp. NBC_01497]|nr:hypothetical protein [Streptomyces sp. NBC_01497]